MKTFIFIFSVIFFSSFQCSDVKRYDEIIIPKLKVNAKINTQPLEIKEKFILQENDEVILSDISDLEFNSDTTKILIVDPTNRTANLYDYKSGKILNWIYAGETLTDLLINNGNNENILLFNGQVKYKKIKTFEYNDFDIDKTTSKRYLQNSFYKVIYNNDEIYLLTLIYYFAKSIENKKIKLNKNYTLKIKKNEKILLNKTCILKTDENFRIKSFVFLNNPNLYDTYPDTFFYLEKDSSFLISTYNPLRYIIQKKYDSLLDFALYDKQGKFIQEYSFLPKIFSDNHLSSDFYDKSFLCSINNNLYSASTYDLAIYQFCGDLFKKKVFNLYNLPFSNDTGFYYYPKILKSLEERGKSNIETRASFLFQLFPIRISNVMKCGKEKILVQLTVVDTNKAFGYYTILQEYNLNGKLISQTNIFNDSNSFIEWIAFDNKNKYLLFARKSNFAWYLEKREWVDYY